MSVCPHCASEVGPDTCWPYSDSPGYSPDCWELKVASASEHLSCEVYVPRGTELPRRAIKMMDTVRELEEQATQ